MVSVKTFILPFQLLYHSEFLLQFLHCLLKFYSNISNYSQLHLYDAMIICFHLLLITRCFFDVIKIPNVLSKS